MDRTVFESSQCQRDRPSMRAGFLDHPHIDIAPHPGYRDYFTTPIQPDALPKVFDPADKSADFPTVAFAEGWAYAEHALRNYELERDERSACLGEAALHWNQACTAIQHVYDTYPGQFLLWPGVRWRYQLSLDTLPSMQAIVDANSQRIRSYNNDLLSKSRENTRETLRILMDKHGGIVEKQAGLLERPDENAKEILRAEGRKGSIIGIAVEAAGVYLAQMGDPRYAITPASLRREEAGKSGADMMLWDSRRPRCLHSGQVKRRVDSVARKKYRHVPLICGVHHMRIEGEPLLETLHAIVENRREADLRRIGRQLVAIMQGDRTPGCSRYNFTSKQLYRRTAHANQRAA